ncbi:MAG: RlmE family RNA methyltransferase [Alphaproteobacteria bacterium]
MTKKKQNKGISQPTGRFNSVRVKTAKGRKISSTRWLQRQLNDPYVHEARRLGLRSRAAFKIEEIDHKYNLFKKGKTVVDLGAAPGGWSQYAAKKNCPVVALDLLQFDPIPGVEILEGDFLDPAIQDAVIEKLNGRVDLILSDIAPPTTGHKQTDHIRMMAICDEALIFIERTLNKGGNFVIKIFKGGAENEYIVTLRKHFDKVKIFKPDSSRKESVESYLIATGYKG